MSGSPEYGSVSSGNSMSTSVISLPRSPQPMKMTTSALDHLAIWCCVTVLPAPNGPGMHAAPPFRSGKNVSMTRVPGHERLGERELAPVGARDAHRPGLHHQLESCSVPSSERSVPTVSSTVYVPEAIG
jgi:hypothetical protein